MHGEDVVVGIRTREHLVITKNNELEAYAELLILHARLYLCSCLCNLFSQLIISRDLMVVVMKVI
jgi:hypothetical protein